MQNSLSKLDTTNKDNGLIGEKTYNVKYNEAQNQILKRIANVYQNQKNVDTITQLAKMGAFKKTVDGGFVSETQKTSNGTPYQLKLSNKDNSRSVSLR